MRPVSLLHSGPSERNSAGMTYQVSDTTVRNPRIRRAVLSHALLSYLFDLQGRQSL